MPRVKIDYIVSFSSEDPENPANNLLALEVNKKKWLGSKGEASCSVVLQLTRAIKINSLQIGVYHAALVEVLVGLSEKPNDPYQVLVPSCIFLSPTDSRRGEGIERVRSFSEDQLVADTRDKKWDRVRVVCSQPYNKHCKYGLSFIHIFEPESKHASKLSDTEKKTTAAEKAPLSVPEKTTGAPEKVTGAPEKATAVPDRLLSLNMDTFSSDEDEFKPGELFRRHQMGANGVASTESQIRQATSHALKNIDDTSTKLMKTPISKTKRNQPESDSKRHIDKQTDEKTDRQRDSLMYTNDDEQPHSKIDHIVNRHKDEKAKRDEERKKQEQRLAKQKEEQRKERDRKEKKDEGRNDDRTSQDDRRNDRTPQSKKGRENSGSRDDAQRKKDRTPHSKTPRDVGASSSHTQDDRKDRKRLHSSEKKKKNKLCPGPVSSTPHTLLRDVVFALSGYENPRRATIRDMAIAMGAKFERDWNDSCTHLICAFPNTPKLKTVRSSRRGQSAIVVTAEWVERCCERRRLLPWQWFATETEFRVDHCTDDEEEEEEPQPVSEDEQPQSPQPKKRQRTESPRAIKKRSFLCSDDEEEQNGTSQRVLSPNLEKDSPKHERQSSSDEADGNTTDVGESELQQVEIDEMRVLPDFFEGYTFSMDPALADTFDCQLLSRYVQAYGGLVVESSELDDDVSVDYWLCAGADSECERARARVRADWVWRCHSERKLASPGPYVF